MSQATQVFGRTPTTPSSEPEEHAGIVASGSGMMRSAAFVAIAYVLSRILGLLREMILARQFGTSPDMDAYVIAFRIPDLLFLVVMSGAFGAAFIPVFAGFIDKGERDKASRLASSILTWTGIGVLVLCAVAFVLADPLTTLVAWGYDDYTHDLTVELMRPLLLSPVFLGLAIACKGILEAQNLFTLPAFAPVLYNITIIIGAAFFTDRYGIKAVVWAVIIGALLQLFLQAPAVVRTGLALKPTLDRTVEGLSEVLRLLGPRVLGLAAFQLNFIFVSAFASTLGPQYVSGLNYAWLLLMLPHGVLALSMSTVAFPSLAALYNRGDQEGFGRLMDRTMRPLLFLSIPASVALLMIGREVIMIIFEGGRFTSESTDIVAGAFRWFALGLVGYGLAEIVTRVFYAMKDTVTPVITGILTVILNVIMCKLLMGSLQAEGLAISLSITTACEAIIMMLFLRYRTGQIFSDGFFMWLMRTLGATLVMGIVIGISRPWLADVLNSDTSFIIHVIYFAICFGLYGATFVWAAWLFRIPELMAILNRIEGMIPASIRARIPGM
ncbi:MAG: murein biosynthesis integral membrane protein MurJ [Thermomicrobiales bacterium]|nr:murein biosynthesis integral membrane protein MurJ [Thermomicrobiales bacterium]